MLQKPKGKIAFKAVTGSVAVPRSKAAPKKTVQTTLKINAKRELSKKRLRLPVDVDEPDLQHNVLHEQSPLSATSFSGEEQMKAPNAKKHGGKPFALIKNETTTVDGAHGLESKRGGLNRAVPKGQPYLGVRARTCPDSLDSLPSLNI